MDKACNLKDPGGGWYGFACFRPCGFAPDLQSEFRNGLYKKERRLVFLPAHVKNQEGGGSVGETSGREGRSVHFGFSLVS